VGTLPAEPTRSGYAFTGWNTRADGTGMVFTAATPVTGSIIVYAQWAKPGAGITLGFDDPGSGVFDQTTFTVKKSGSPASQTLTLKGTWISQEWRVDGSVRGTGTVFTVNAGDYTPGGHTLGLTVYDGTAFWSKTLGFTVSN
jgi:uncharacterized repeat protein (TIGR02543 family)